MKYFMPIFLLWSTSAFAVVLDIERVYQGARPMGMGGAFIAVADDENGLFYNAAGLAGVRNYTLTAISPTVEASNDLISNYPVYSQLVNNSSLTSINELMGKDIAARGQAGASLVVPGFGVAAIVQSNFGSYLNNPSYPSGNILFTYTYGVQVGYGQRLLKFKHHKGELRFGVAGKILYRGGGIASLSLSELMTFNTQALINSFPQPGLGIGADVGLQYVLPVKKKFSFMSGLAVTDIGNTAFATGAPSQMQNVALGTALRYHNYDMLATLAIDYNYLQDTTQDWREKTHVGLELKFPYLTLMTGLNQLHPTWGVGLDVFMLRLSYVSYAQDISTTWDLNVERRQMVQAMVKFEI